jgi:hypothetical protein
MSDDNYYVYAYLREDDTPYYIGKGKGKRAWDKNHSLKLPSNKNKIIIIKDELTSTDALNLEKALISEYGRKDIGTGILRNQTDGGDGITNPSERWRKQARDRMIGDKNPSRQPGASERISKSQLVPEVVENKRKKMSGEFAPHYGKFGSEHPRFNLKDSDETRKLKSQSSTGKPKSQSHKDAIGKSHRGIPKPNSGKGNTNTKGRIWFNDGKKSFMLFENDPKSLILNKGRLKNVR